MNLINQYKGLPKQVYIICTARIITAMGSFVFSFTTLLVTGILGMSAIAAAYMNIVFSAASVCGALFFGRLADRHDRKKVLLFIMGLNIINLIVGGFIVYNKAVLVCICMVSFCFSGFIPVLAAMISDITTESNRKESFSLLYLCINIGYSMGQVIAGTLFYNYTRWIFWGQALAFIFGASVIFFCLKGLPDLSEIRYARALEVVESDGHKNQGMGQFFKVLSLDKVLLIFLAAAVLIQYTHSEIFYLLPLQLTDVAGLEASSKWISYMWFTNGVCCIVMTPILLHLTKGFTQITNLAIAALAYAVGLGGLFFVQKPSAIWMILPFAFIWTAGEVIVNTGTGVFIADRAKPEFRASYQSLYSFAGDFGRCLGPVTMGYLLQVISYGQGWLATSGVSLTAVAILLVCRNLHKKELVEK